MNPSGFELMTFLLVAQCLNQVRHRVTLLFRRTRVKDHGISHTRRFFCLLPKMKQTFLSCIFLFSCAQPLVLFFLCHLFVYQRCQLRQSGHIIYIHTLYYIILCYIILYYIILYHIILYYIILYYIILYYIILYYIILYYIILYYIILYYIISYRIVSYRIVSYRIVSYRIVSYHIILYTYHCVTLACSIQYSNMLQRFVAQEQQAIPYKLDEQKAILSRFV